MIATNTQCPTLDQLEAFAAGQLSDLDSETTYQHLSECESCAAKLDTLDDNHDSLVAELRQPDFMGSFGEEPECQAAVIKALGSLAIAVESAEEALPRAIGEYEILRPLGSGGMGNVYLARHTKLGREVALKVLAIHRTADKRLQQRFEGEMRTIGQLSHPNIVTAHDARDIEGTAVLITEYIDGFDLGQLVRLVGPLSTADACEIARLVCVALAYTHDAGFVHRDIKPSNIMLSRTGEVKLLDLGLARFQLGDPERVEVTGTGQTMGSADYIAPEQVTDSRNVDARTDIYSLGCTLMKLLTGQAPFSGDEYQTPFAKMTAHLKTPAPRLHEFSKDFPKGLASLVDSMLEKNPDKRPQSPAIIAERLSEFTSGADLIQLGQTQLIDLTENKPQTTASVMAQPPSRRNFIWAAIASGFLSWAIGICMGILITIRYPDGTTAQISVPAGSQVTIDHSNDEKLLGQGKVDLQEDVDIEPIAETEHPTVKTSRAADTDLSTQPTPSLSEDLEGERNSISAESPATIRLEFRVLHQKEDLSGQLLNAAIRRLEWTLDANPQDTMVITNAGSWLPIADGVYAPIIHQFRGRRFALVSNSSRAHVTWNLLKQHLQGMRSAPSVPASNNSEKFLYTFDLIFDDALAKKMRTLTSSYLKYPLGIVVNGTIRAAPIIDKDMGNFARIEGRFSPEELRQLYRSLYGVMDDPSTTSIPPGDSKDVGSLQVQNSLSYIGRVFRTFELVYKKFPGSQNVREGGRRIRGDTQYPFSWRVAILPFTEHSELFIQYRFDEPWDSEHNLTLLDKMPDLYRSPFTPDDTPTGHTHFLGFATEQGALGTGTGHKLSEFTDGLSTTLLIVEQKKSVPWTKPEDLTDTDIQPLEEGTLRYLTADGFAYTMKPIDPVQLQKLITRNGGEQ